MNALQRSHVRRFQGGRRLTIEPLEARIVMAAYVNIPEVYMYGNALMINCSESSAAKATVVARREWCSGDNHYENIVVVTLNGRSEKFRQGLASQIAFLGSPYADSFTNNTSLPCWAWGGNGNDILIGGSGNDYLAGEAGMDRLGGGAGNDQLEGGLDNDGLGGGAGNDQYIYTHYGSRVSLGADAIVDTSGDNQLDFRRFDSGVSVDLQERRLQTVSSGLLALQITAGGTSWSIFGTPYSDTLKGNQLANQLDGGAGADVLEGRGGNDILAGGTGDDFYVFSGTRLGHDTISETSGIDTLEFGSFTGSKNPKTPLTVSLNIAGRQTVCTGHLDLTLTSTTSIERVWGSPYADLIFGNGLDNELLGGGGNDTLYGRAGQDVLIGGDGNDGLFGGPGNDTLTGGAGSDRFLLQDTDSDRVTDNGSADAVLQFRHLAQNWTEEEIISVDAALRMLHERTQNTDLLKLPNSQPLVLLRGAVDSNTMAQYSKLDDTLTFFNLAFTTPVATMRATIHEIAHAWDRDPEMLNSFVKIGGWTKTPGPKDKQGDQGWWYSPKATFVGLPWSAMVPFEDIANSWEAYFLRSKKGLGARVQALDAFFRDRTY